METRDGRAVLQPKLTGFQVSILMSVIADKREAMQQGAREHPDQVASYIASYVEYDHIYTALEVEHDEWIKARGGHV
jgi:hypothetical protein